MGIWLGLGSKDFNWTDQLAKFNVRRNNWKNVGLGFHIACCVYNVFVISVLGFVAQFLEPPDALLDAEKVALRAFARGPGNWIQPSDLFNLRRGSTYWWCRRANVQTGAKHAEQKLTIRLRP